jgi:1-acyl-sn-glycerol-3-phosphate acyltransferase
LEYIENVLAVIFPEGTRVKQGAKSVCKTGLKYYVGTPSAYVVPISINNSWKIVKYGFFH